MELYDYFIAYHEEQGRTFPCTADAFIARAFDFSREFFMTGPEPITSRFGNYEEIADQLCIQGIGQNWEDNE